MQAYKPLFVEFYHLQLILSPGLFNEELIFLYISKVSLVFDGIFVFDIICNGSIYHVRTFMHRKIVRVSN